MGFEYFESHCRLLLNENSNMVRERLAQSIHHNALLRGPGSIYPGIFSGPSLCGDFVGSLN